MMVGRRAALAAPVAPAGPGVGARDAWPARRIGGLLRAATATRLLERADVATRQRLDARKNLVPE